MVTEFADGIISFKKIFRHPIEADLKYIFVDRYGYTGDSSGSVTQNLI
jgi:hypothetical protein